MTTFNDLFNQKVYPKLQDGLNKVIITGIGTPVDAKKKDGSPTQYVPVRMEIVETGRPVVHNVFVDQFISFFVSPIQNQIDPDGTWESVMSFIQELISEKTQLDCWVERVTYIGASGAKSTTNYNFFEPAPKPQTNASTEAAPEDIPF